MKSARKNADKSNKVLIPVSKKTRKSLGIISFDPAGTLQLTGDRWIRVFEIDGDIGNLVEIVEKLSGRIRLTMHLGERCGEETCHISLMNAGECYDTVRKKMELDQALLERALSLKLLSVDEMINKIGNQHLQDAQFSYASYVRGKKDWKKGCFTAITENEDTFLMGERYGKCFVALAYPASGQVDFMTKLKRLGSELYISYDALG